MTPLAPPKRSEREQVRLLAERLRREFVGRKWPNDYLPAEIVALAEGTLALLAEIAESNTRMHRERAEGAESREKACTYHYPTPVSGCTECEKRFQLRELAS